MNRIFGYIVSFALWNESTSNTCAMAEATGVNGVVVQPEELKFALTWVEGERPSSSVKLTNPTNLPVAFAVPATDPDNYEVKPSCGIVPAFGDCIINVTARGLPPVEHQEGRISVLTFDVPPGWGEPLSFPEKHYPLRHHAPDHAITRLMACNRIIRLRWVDPDTEIRTLMNKAADEVSHQNLGLALETLGEAIKLHPDGYSLLSRALVNHSLGQGEGAKRDLQEAERQFSISELAEGMGEHPASSVAYCIISDTIEVPTYTTEKLCGKQMIVDRSVAVTDNQQLDVDVRLTPSIKLRSDGNVELNVTMDSLRFEVVRSQTTDRSDSYPDQFVQSLRIQVRPKGKWHESFSGQFGLIKCSPGNEINLETVQKGMSHGFTASLSVGASPSVSLQWSGNITSGTTFPAFGFKKSTRDGHACLWEYELRAFADGSSTQNVLKRRLYTIPSIPEAVSGQVNYPNLGKDASFAATWMIAYATAMEHRNEIEFTISVEAKLLGLRRCRNLKHLVKSPEHKLVVRKEETHRICVFAIARVKSFIGKST